MSTEEAKLRALIREVGKTIEAELDKTGAWTVMLIRCRMTLAELGTLPAGLESALQAAEGGRKP